MLRLSAKIVFLLFGVCLGIAHADTVTIDNGDRITGTVIRLEDGVLVMATPYAEQMQIDRNRVEAIDTDADVEVHLEGGEMVRGPLATREDGRIAVAPNGTRQVVVTEWEKIAAINGSYEPDKLRGSITVGASMQVGNTDRKSASLALEATRRDDRHRFHLEVLHNYAKEDGEVNTRNTFGAFKYDYFFIPRIYGYLGIEMLRDRFKDLNLRTVVGPGVGYQVWDGKKRSLALEAGLAYFNEDLDDGKDDHWITGRLAGNFRCRLWDRIDFGENLVVYPNLENLGQLTLRNEAFLASPVAFGWALRLTSIIDHDSDPDSEDVEKTDFFWILGLQYEF